MDCSNYKELLKDLDLRAHLKNVNSSMLEKYDYFIGQMGKHCAYAEACIKIMKEDIDDYYAGRETSGGDTHSIKEGLPGDGREVSPSRDS